MFPRVGTFLEWNYYAIGPLDTCCEMDTAITIKL